MISKDKQYRTRDGDEVRIYATDGEKGYEVHGAYKSPSGWIPVSWDINGVFIHDYAEEMYLIEVKPRIKREYWVNLYPSEVASRIVFECKKDADKQAASARIACVKVVIDCEEGEGL